MWEVTSGVFFTSAREVTSGVAFTSASRQTTPEVASASEVVSAPASRQTTPEVVFTAEVVFTEVVFTPLPLRYSPRSLSGLGRNFTAERTHPHRERMYFDTSQVESSYKLWRKSIKKSKKIKPLSKRMTISLLVRQTFSPRSRIPARYRADPFFKARPVRRR